MFNRFQNPIYKSCFSNFRTIPCLFIKHFNPQSQNPPVSIKKLFFPNNQISMIQIAKNEVFLQQIGAFVYIQDTLTINNYFSISLWACFVIAGLFVSPNVHVWGKQWDFHPYPNPHLPYAPQCKNQNLGGGDLG